MLINKEAHAVLEDIVARSNDGFDGGEITKSDILNWLVSTASKTFSESEIKTLRSLHFNEKKMLYALLRGSQNEADLPEEIRKALREHFGVADQTKRRGAKPRDDLSTAGSVDKLGTA